MTPASGSKRPRKGAKRAEPFIIEATRDGVAVYRRPVGNLAIPRLCGVLPTRPMAVEFARLLRRAETAAPDLFLEATDDGIEALEAVIAACLESATAGAAGGRPRGRGRAARNGRGARPRDEAGEGAGPERAEGADDVAGDARESGRRNGGRRRGRRGRGGKRARGENGGDAPGGEGAPPAE